MVNGVRYRCAGLGSVVLDNCFQEGPRTCRTLVIEDLGFIPRRVWGVAHRRKAVHLVVPKRIVDGATVICPRIGCGAVAKGSARHLAPSAVVVRRGSDASAQSVGATRVGSA